MLERAVLFDFELSGRRMRLWKRVGESYEHVLMKALGYAMFVQQFPALEIERDVGLRYKPDVVANKENGQFAFWGECGTTNMRKAAWLMKRTAVELLVLFKIERSVMPFVDELRLRTSSRYRPQGRVQVVNFVDDISERTASRKITRVPQRWYTLINV